VAWRITLNGRLEAESLVNETESGLLLAERDVRLYTYFNCMFHPNSETIKHAPTAAMP